MDIVCAQWNHDGSILAIAGITSLNDKESNLIQFFTPFGQHLKTLKVPGNKLKSISWEGNSLRLVIAIDSVIYFAIMRPTYKWAYLNNTIVYSFTRPNKSEQSVIFYDIKTSETNLKYMKNLLGIVGAGDNCALISQAEDSSPQSQQTTIGIQSSTLVSASLALGSNKIQHQTQYAIVLCNSIGTPLEYKYIDFQPQYWAMNQTHLCVASRSYFYLWNFQSMVDKSSLKKQQQTFEKLVFIDNPNASIQVKTDDPAIVAVGPELKVNFF
jgi:WD repeat-containing protein 35